MARKPVIAALVASTAAAVLSTVPSAAETAPPTAAPEAAAQATGDVPTFAGEALRVIDAFDANQGVAVDDAHVYAVNNSTITKHDRATGEALLQFVGGENGPIEHLDSGVVVDGLLYAAHSNYPEWPMESSVEVFDAATMEHVDTHSFGIYRGSLTWLDRHDDAWWAAFANYNRIQDGMSEPYGLTYNTQVVKMDDDFQVVESWTIPKEILDRFEVMSNSGGSWGPDGRLWLTGHDLPEAYVMTLPDAGAELVWVATVSLPGIEGQGIAWDDAGEASVLWGISRQHAQLVEFSVPVADITGSAGAPSEVRGPGEFERD